MRILDLNKETTSNILESLLKRSPNSYGEYEARVAAIIEEVRKNRDAAVFSYTKQFDRAEINADNIVVTDEEINEAYATVAPELLDVIRKSLVNIRAFHSKQLQNSWFTSGENGTILGQKVTPLDKVGVYGSWRKGCLSVFRSDECRSGKSSGRSSYLYDNTTWG